MEAKYLFILLNLALLYGFISIIMESSRKDVMTHWSEKM
jgi:hypothetical protein